MQKGIGCSAWTASFLASISSVIGLFNVFVALVAVAVNRLSEFSSLDLLLYKPRITSPCPEPRKSHRVLHDPIAEGGLRTSRDKT